MRNDIGLDSQCLSYLIDIMGSTSRICESVADQQLALMRIYLYGGKTFLVSPAVNSECLRMKDKTYAKLHESYMRVLFGVFPVKNSDDIYERVQDLQRYHAGEKNRNDCLALAEAENAEFEVLLTFDVNFYSRLSGKAKGVRIMMPMEYWLELAIPRGANPVIVPHDSNPLAIQGFWKW